MNEDKALSSIRLHLTEIRRQCCRLQRLEARRWSFREASPVGGEVIVHDLTT